MPIDMQADKLKGHLDLLLLEILMAGPTHGYAVIVELRRRSEGSFDLPEGTIYPALHRLERRGLLHSEWRVVQGRRRRLYRVTPAGATTLAEERGDWEAFVTAVQAVQRGTPAAPDAGGEPTEAAC
jgi:DNA-binding PadR family transcriptional regulator